MKWLLVVLTFNVYPYGWETQGQVLTSKMECRRIAAEINDKQNSRNAEANLVNQLVLEQTYAWCEKN